MTSTAAFVANGRLDVLASNALARSLQAEVFESQSQPPNLARYCFLDRRSESFHDNWAATADITVAILRTEAGRNPHDRALTDLVGELATRSDEFRTRWARHDVRLHTAAASCSPRGRRRLGSRLQHHPAAGRPRAVPDRVHRRTRLTPRGQARTARQLGCDARRLARKQRQRRLKRCDAPSGRP